jgi:hypothetical protein
MKWVPYIRQMGTRLVLVPAQERREYKALSDENHEVYCFGLLRRSDE